MTYRHLDNKPLVESILEIRWVADPVLSGDGLQISSGNQQPLSGKADSYYKLFFYKMYESLIKSGYPTYKELDNARIPDDLVGHLVQHRFMSSESEWPMVQVGPGIATLNETNKYDWEDFRNRASELINLIYEVHPSPQSIQVQNVSLRYINAIELDFFKEDARQFIKNLKVDISIDDSLFDETSIDMKPINLNLNMAYRVTNPPGILQSNLSTGFVEGGSPAIIWELVFNTREDIPVVPEAFDDWLKSAHDVIDNWFRKSIDGELERRFKGE